MKIKEKTHKSVWALWDGLDSAPQNLPITRKMEDLEDAGQRYAFLLKPVKDLATNWSIDIASQLAQYVDNLQKEMEARESDNGLQRKNFNFAEAAVLISGSATVYGRKVDYVHQTALGFCSLFEESKQKKKKGKDGADDDGGEGGVDSEGENLPEENKLDPFTLIDFSNLKWCEDSALMIKHRSKPPPLLPLVPMTMMQLADFEKTNVPFYNKSNKNEIVNKKDDFKINTCFILSEGVALLDLKNIDYLDKFSVMISDDLVKKECESRPNTAVPPDNEPGAMTVNISDGEELKHTNDSNPMGDIEPSIPPDQEFMVKLLGSYENLDKIPSSQSSSNGMAPERPSSRIETMRRDTRSMFEALRPSASDFDVLADRNKSFDVLTRRKSASAALNGVPQRHLESFVGAFDADDDFMDAQIQNIQLALQEHTAVEIENLALRQNEPDDDAWMAQFEELDPYKEILYKNRPLKVNKNCWNLAMNQVKKRDRKIKQECEAIGKAYFPSVKDFIQFNLYRRRLKKKEHVLAQFSSFLCNRGLLALNPILYEEEKRRGKIRREREIQAKSLAAELRRSRSRIPKLQTPDDDADADNNESDEIAQIMEDLVQDKDGMKDDPNAIIDKGNVFNDLPEEELNANAVTGFLYISDLEGNTTRKSRRKSRKVLDPDELEADAEVAAAFDNDDYDDGGGMDVPPRPISQMSYEELVTYHLRKYWSIAEESRSKFCERVEKWEEKMIPLLEEEATRPEFSIHTYGTEILDKYGNDGIGKVLSFKDIVHGVPRYEISRYFLSTLLLTNTQNLEIQSETASEDDEDVINTMKMQLVGLERHHKMFEDEQRLLTGAPLK